MAEDEERGEVTQGLVHVWQAGSDTISPRSFQIFTNHSVLQVALGAHHCAFLTTDHILHCYGNNQHGQLGIGNLRDSLKEPLLVETLKDKLVIAVACGARHTGAVCHDGSLFCWGDAREGQCGVGTSTPHITTPQEVAVMDTGQVCDHGIPGQPVRVKMRQIACGETHTLAVSESAELWGWGSPLQVGVVDNLPILTPQKVSFLAGRKVLGIDCGRQNSIALVQAMSSREQKLSSGKNSQSSSRSGSPVMNNVQVHRVLPSTCVKCKREIYTYTETSDACIISDEHHCPLGLEVTEELKHNQPNSDKVTHKQSENETESSQINNVSKSEKKENSASGDVAVEGENESKSLNNCDSPNSALTKVPENPSLTENSATLPSVEAEKVTAGLASNERQSAEELPNYSNSTNCPNVNNKDVIDSSPAEVSEKLSDRNVSENNAEGLSKRIKNKPADITISDMSTRTNDGEVESPTSESCDKTDTSNRSRHPSTKSEGAIHRSRSSFLDEDEAKVYLQKQLCMEEDSSEKKPPVLAASSAIVADPPESPFRKQVENFMNMVPNSTAMLQGVSNLTSLTTKVVSNIKTSIDKSMFGYVSSQSIDYDSLSKSSSFDSLTPPNDRTPTDGTQKSIKGDDSPKKSKSNLSRKTSLNAGLSVDSDKDSVSSHVKTPDVSLNTEVYTWGSGSLGQLGHADLLDRPQPYCVRALNGKQVVKVQAGANHCLALSSAAVVYSWGDNSYGQLGHNDSHISTPKKVKFVTTQNICDIACGEHHSVFAAETVGYSLDLYYVGKQQTNPDSSSLSRMHLPVKLSPLKKLGWLKQVAAGGDLCACLTDKNIEGSVATFHEFATTERSFFRQLDRMAASVLAPYLISESFGSLESSLYGPTMKMMIEAFLHLTKKVGENSVELSFAIQSSVSIMAVQFSQAADRLLSIFQHYSKCFGDSLALGGFDFYGKTSSPFLETKFDVFAELLDESKLDKTNVGVTFRRVMQVPLRRMKEYARLASKFALNYPQNSQEHSQLTQISQNWESLKQMATGEHTLAENTRAFWEACPPKFAEVYRTPGRRLLRESKTHPLNLPSAGRFSTHWFLLFNDVFVHSQYSTHQSFHLSTVWAEAIPESDQNKNGICLTTPEDTLILTAESQSVKADWLWSLNDAIVKVLTDQKNLSRSRLGTTRSTPPSNRNASYTFTKYGPLKDARYVGMWQNGKMHGQGELQWPDNRKYVGRFKHGAQNGYGVWSLNRAEGQEIYKGIWKDGKLNGLGSVKYASGDIYEGYFRDNQRHGHGVFKQGKLMSSLASIYIGEWNSDQRSGYGVMDDIHKGEKYMGMWQDDCCHGNGIVVTLDGMYYEGTFVQHKMSGPGIMITDDGCCYEGEFSGGTMLSGKGKLTLSNGDYIDGLFSGQWTDGIKINGTYHRSAEPFVSNRKSMRPLCIMPEKYGKLSVTADKKWQDIFQHCRSTLGCQGDKVVDVNKAWEVVAVHITDGKKALKASKKSTGKVHNLDELEKIPPHNTDSLNLESYHQIRSYLAKAFETPYHPLGKLIEGLVDVYRATYMGVGAHPRLLHHAREEVKSVISRVYKVVRILFPELPVESDPHFISKKGTKSEPPQDGASQSEQDVPKMSEDKRRKTDDSESRKQEGAPIIPADKNSSMVNGESSQTEASVSTEHLDVRWLDEEEEEGEYVTPVGLLHPLVLPKVYPPLFTLYALYNEKDDERYWERLHKWNRQSDIALLTFLGVEQNYWLFDEEELQSPKRKISTLKDHCYKESIETLQHISTSFGPAEKLLLIQRTFDVMTKTVRSSLGSDHLWCMDDLFPVFQFVVVRARIPHLGAEIHMIDDLMEKHLEHGELGLMFTTLKACYFQIQHEKMAS